MTTNFETLYKKNKNGTIQEWEVWAEGDKVCTRYGKMYGAKQEATKTAKPKNVGKANETTPEEQAELETQAMWNKRIEKDHFKTPEEAETNLIFLPMLAHTLGEKERKEMEFPIYVQPKMDGVRCLARWKDGRIQLLTRGGKEYVVPHLSQLLENYLEPNQVLDGEIYIHGVMRQDINALVKKYRTEEYGSTGYCSADLQFWIYDTFYTDKLDMPFNERFDVIRKMDFELTDGILQEVETETVYDFASHAKLHQRIVGYEKFEGTIIRKCEGTYELAQRSRGLLKVKDFQDAEYVITGYDDGVGRYEGCVIWECETKEGKKFNVVPKGTLEQKKEWFKEATYYIGEEITVKYQTLSKDGIPEFPVGLGFRIDGDK